eukprot:gb/GECG01011833.1/.p1 GENE.gb/GECG01011833.1/~~gb/GECG01011833.1/.p1  ORF type:complete len:1174 (+),score=115.66 gb/GECG01011833.1/:1-3522(+)
MPEESKQNQGRSASVVGVVEEGPRMRGLAQLACDSDDEEGLSEDRFLRTRYIPPSKGEAYQKCKESMFDAGKASVWGTTLTELYSMGVGIGLYFQLLCYLSVIMLCCAFIMTPTLTIFGSSNNLPQEDIDFLSLTRVSLGNFGHPAEGSQNATSTIFIDGFGRVTIKNAALAVGWSAFIVALFLLGFILWWRRRIKQAVRLFDINNITMSDYTVYATGFPWDANREEIRQHFDNLYNLWEDDWTYGGSVKYLCLDRKAAKRPKFLSPSNAARVRERVEQLRRKGIMLPYPPDHSNIAPVEDVSNTDDDSYMNSWVAELSIAHPNGALIRKYRQLTKKFRQIRSARGLIKKYTQGLSAEANPTKRAKALARLKKLEEELRQIDIRHGCKYSEECVGAFVVFNNEESLRRCLYDYGASHTLFTRFFQPPPLRFTRSINGKVRSWKLSVSKAPEPEDVTWENLEISQFKRILRRIGVNFILLLLIIFSLFILFLLGSQEEVLSNNLPTDGFCQDDLPTLAFGTEDIPPDARLVRNEELGDQVCDTSEAYITWESSEMEPLTNTTMNPCLSPCVDLTGDLECTGPSGETYQHQDVVDCYCSQELDQKIGEQGIFFGIIEMTRSPEELCQTFVRKFALARSMTVIAAAAVVLLNVLLKDVLRRVTKLERFDSSSQEKTAAAAKIFLAQFFNTGLAILLTNLNFPFEEVKLGSVRLLSGEFRTLNSEWHGSVGASITVTMLLNIFGPHLATVFRALIWRCLRRCGTRQAVIQEEMDELYSAESFSIETRYPVLLNTFAVTLFYGAGMPILFVFASASFVVSYWVDKWMLLKLYKRPPFIDQSLAELVLSVFPFSVILYLVMGLYMLGDQERIPVLPVNFLGGATGQYRETVDDVDRYDFTGLAKRSLREHTFPLFMLLLVTALSFLIYSTMGRNIFRCLQGLFEVMGRCCNCVVNFRSGECQNLPRFTGSYEYKIPGDMDYELSEEEIEDGWRLIRDQSRGAMAKSKIKLRTESDYLGDTGEKLRTWEVINEYAIASYDIMANSQYQKAIGALEEGNIRAKAERHRRQNIFAIAPTPLTAKQSNRAVATEGLKEGHHRKGNEEYELSPSPSLSSYYHEDADEDDAPTEALADVTLPNRRHGDPHKDEVEEIYAAEDNVDPAPGRRSTHSSPHSNGNKKK